MAAGSDGGGGIYQALPDGDQEEVEVMRKFEAYSEIYEGVVREGN
jgi:hypothetical protein